MKSSARAHTEQLAEMATAVDQVGRLYDTAISMQRNLEALARGLLAGVSDDERELVAKHLVEATERWHVEHGSEAPAAIARTASELRRLAKEIR